MAQRYGLFNDARVTEGNAAFFAFQAAVSTYPGDPLRKSLDEVVAEISAAADVAAQTAAAARGIQLLAGALPFIEYCVWDYTLVSGVALKEFASWVDDLQEVAGAAPESGDVTPFLTGDTSYFVVTLAVLSSHPSLSSWLEYYPEHLSGEQYFERKTIAAILKRLANVTPGPLAHCTNAMFTTMPVAPSDFYSGERLRSEDWSYLRPVY
ncbi:MAG TPA: hypothetical protein VMM80_04905 [Bacteroidota bacterium]|nr:hypothetical protein [Bacteroidota bacterium]